ncbi:MAG: crossover junction endodeoxyribonuclease RuvC [Endomicrobiales bacterium]|nr:crossover junction endodeoxyribonuclease RuvC [Endomicrobiales bacterium]
MIILGVDPGLSMTGWGLIRSRERDDISLVCYGCIKTRSGNALAERLGEIHAELERIIDEHKPEEMAVEELFFSKEARTVASVGQARGAIILTAAVKKLRVFEYNPRHIKMALTGYGSAQKIQIQSMVKTLLKLKEIPKPDDAADALAVAVCHVHTKQR